MTPAHRTLLGISILSAMACNRPPDPLEVTLSPARPTTVDDLVVVHPIPTDPNRRDPVQVTYTWFVTEPGAATETRRPDVTGGRVPAALTVRGQVWRVEVSLTDGQEVLEPVSAEVEIVNTPPEVTWVRKTPAEVQTFDAVRASFGAEDADGDPVEVQLTWYVDGAVLDISDPLLTGEHFDKGEDVWVEVTAFDGVDRGEPRATPAIRVRNTPPTITGARIAEAEVREASVLTCAPEGWFDADDDPVRTDTIWVVNGLEVASTPTLTGASFDRGDVIRCGARPLDDGSVGDWTFSPAVEVQNTAPRVGGARLDNPTPDAISPLGFQLVDAVDDDGDPISATATWWVDDAEVFAGEVLPARSLRRGQRVRAVVIATDGASTADPVTTEEVTTVNAPPAVRSITLLPDPLRTDSRAFPSVDADDPDGDRITYGVVWKVNGSVVAHTGSVLDGLRWFDRGDEVVAEVTPNDGYDAGTPATSPVATVSNSAPTAPVVQISPLKPKSVDDLWCEVVVPSTDADDDPLDVTVSWTRNGAPFLDTDTLELDDDFVDTEFVRDLDVFACTVTVSDGEASVSSTSTVTVQDWEGPRTFSNCTATGRLGPSQGQCDTAYRGTNLEAAVTVTSGIQSWTVPQDGTYRIEAWGSGGGKGTFGSAVAPRGARVRGDFSLRKGDVLNILVGQPGTNVSYAAGGGGGTWVTTSAGANLVVAGGGGGLGYGFFSTLGCDGQVTTSARNTSSWSSTSCGTAGTPAQSGGSWTFRSTTGTFAYQYYYGGGGAGHTGDGNAYGTADRARSYRNGGAGGDGVYTDGGFGGGGTGDSYNTYVFSGISYGPFYDSWGSGGGGGWTGGGGGYYVGGGGGSFNGGSNQSNSAAVRVGAGQVVIDLVR